MNPEVLSVWAMALIGLMGAGHCAGMCGGIVAALGFSAAKDSSNKKHSQWPLLLSYNIGRISSYALAGAAAGWLGLVGEQYLALGPYLRGIAGLLLILMGFYLAGWWNILTQLERLGALLWRKIHPYGKDLFQVKSVGKGFILGMLWGWLPCGLVYSALAYAAALADPLSGAMAMAAFGLGTMPAMLLGGVFSQQLRQLLQRQLLRWPMALVMICFGIWTLSGIQHFAHDEHSQHGSSLHQHH